MAVFPFEKKLNCSEIPKPGAVCRLRSPLCGLAKARRDPHTAPLQHSHPQTQRGSASIRFSLACIASRKRPRTNHGLEMPHPGQSTTDHPRLTRRDPPSCSARNTKITRDPVTLRQHLPLSLIRISVTGPFAQIRRSTGGSPKPAPVA